MTTPARGFETAEFRDRLVRAQTAMAETGIDILLLTTEPEIRYFTGFLTQFWQSPTRPWFLLVPQAGNPVATIPEIGRSCMEKTWIRDIRGWNSPNPGDEGISLLSEAILELADRTACLGIMKGAESHLRMPLADYEKLLTSLKGCKILDASPLIRKLRSIKSAAETEKIRHVCQAASRAFEKLPERITPGMTQRDTFQAFKHVLLDEGVDDVSYLVGGAGQGGYNDIISPASERELAKGDVLILDTGCVWDGYFCDFDRNYSIGKPSGAVTNAHRIIWDATQAALELARPGITCKELFYCMNNATGGTQGSVGRLGHGLGMQLTEHPSLAAFDETVLEEGMVLTLEPGYEFAPGKMLVHEENIVVRGNHAELLTIRTPKELPVIGGF